MMAKTLKTQSKLSIKVMLTSRCGNRTTVYLLSPRSRTFSRRPVLGDIDTEQCLHISYPLIIPHRLPSDSSSVPWASILLVPVSYVPVPVDTSWTFPSIIKEGEYGYPWYQQVANPCIDSTHLILVLTTLTLHNEHFNLLRPIDCCLKHGWKHRLELWG